MVASLRDWSSLLFEWNVFRGDHWSPVCMIGVRCCLSGTCVGATIGRPFCVIGVRCCLSGTCVGATIGRPFA